MKFYTNKRSLSYTKNIKSWNKGNKQKIIAQPSNAISKSSRNGLILT